VQHVVQRISLKSDVPAIADREPHIFRIKRPPAVVECRDHSGYFVMLIRGNDWRAFDHAGIVVLGLEILVMVVESPLRHIEDFRNHRIRETGGSCRTPKTMYARALLTERRVRHELGVLL
jgi:hypothetical protein